MDIEQFYTRRFAKLDSLLRDADMACGPDVWLLVVQLLERLKRQNKLPEHEAQLMPLLCPLFCRTPEEQDRFAHLFAQCLSDEGKALPGIATVNRIIAPAQGIYNNLRTKVKRLDKYWWLAGALILLLIVAVIVFYPPPEPSKELIFNPPDPLPKPTPKEPVVETSKLLPSTAPIITIISPQPEPDDVTINDIPWLVIVLFYAIPWVPVTIYLLRNYFKKLKFSRAESSGEALFNKLRFDRNLLPIWGGAAAERSLRDLRAARFVPTRRLNVAATVAATARSGGYFQPIYRNHRAPPEHVILVRSLDYHDQHAGLAQELAERFKTLGLQVQVYRFRDDPRALTHWNTATGDYDRIQLEQALAKHGNARLLVISETDILFHPYSGEVRSWLANLNPWQNKVWLHPHDAQIPHAKLLAKHDFLMLPLTRDSLPQLVNHLLAAQISRLTAQPVDPSPLPELIADHFDAWLDEYPPDGVDLPDMLRQLQQYLGSDGLCILRAAAVYLKPNWELTKALDFLLCGHSSLTESADQREQRLFRLSRLPWLTHGVMPDWLREYLLQHADPAERQRIVTAWQSLFSQLTDQDQPGSLQLEFHIPPKQQFKLRFTEWQAMPDSDALNDPIFAHILLDGKLGLLDFRLPQHLKKWMPQASQWIVVRPALMILFCLTLAATWGIQQYGHDIYNKIQPQRNIEQYSQWHVTLQYQSATKALATALQQHLQQDQFQVAQPSEMSDASIKRNTILYSPGGDKAADRVKHRLGLLAYGADVIPQESPALDASTIQVQLADLHGVAFRDPMRTVQAIRLPFEPEMVSIPPGKFLMGSPKTEANQEPDEDPQHEVTIAYAFEISKYEITFDEYDAFANATKRQLPSDRGWGRGKRPVINVTFDDAQAYVNWLSDQTGKQYRLPTEAEWEYAARAGTQTAYWWGADIGKNNAVCNGCGSEWDKKQTAPVGSFRPNRFGLHDTAGNVSEWVEDCSHQNYQGAPADGSAWKETNGGNCSRRVVRGGSWFIDPQNLRSANRNRINTDVAINVLGIRIARAF